MATKTYKLVYPKTGAPGRQTGAVVKDLTDEQAERMKRYAKNPQARLQSITEVKGQKK